MLRFNGKDEPFTKGAEVGVDDERDNGDNTIRTYSPRPQVPGSHNKKSSPPTSTPTRIRRHSFISPDEKPPKGMNYTMPLPPTKVVTPADAAAMLDSLTSTYFNHEKKFNYHQHHPHKYSVDEKQSKKQLKRSISFNHSNRSTSPRPIDVAEVLATTVSFVRENNKKLDRLSDEVRSDGQSSDNDMESVMSDDSTDSWHQLNDNREIENEIADLGVQLDNMEQKYKEQIRGKNKLIEQLESSLRRSDKEVKKKKETISQLEKQLEASRTAISEIIEQQQHDIHSSLESEQIERLLEEKDKTIEELEKKIQIFNKRAIQYKDKDEKLETMSNQLLKYQSLENEWKEKQMTLDSLTDQFKVLQKREVELNEKDALIETLNLRLDTSQKVIAELREKHAPHEMLRQLRQKDYIIDDLTRQIENIDATNKDKEDDISELVAKLNKLNEEKKSAEKLSDKLKEQTAQIEPLKKKLEDALDENYEIKSQIAHKDRQLKEATKVSQNSQEKFRIQEQNLSELRQEIAQARQTLSIQANETREKERILTTLRNENSVLLSKQQGLYSAINEKEQRIQQLESVQNVALKNDPPKNDPPKNDSSEDEVKVSKGEVRLTALQKVLNSKIESCREYEKKITTLEKEFDGFKKQVEESQSSCSEKEIKITRLVKMNRQLKEEVTDLKQKMEEKEKELVSIKSKIPKPNPGKAPSVASRTSRTSMTSRRTSDSSRAVPLTRTKSSTSTSSVEERRSIISDSSRVSLTRTKSTVSISSFEGRRSSIIVPKREVKPRISPSINTVDVLKKNITPKKESSPINRSAVTQRKREMEVVNHMLSGVASSGKNRLQKRTSTVNEAAKKKSTDMVSSDSEHEIKKTPSKKRSSGLSPIMEKNSKSDDSTAPKAKRTTVVTKASTSTQKMKTPLIRPLKK